MTGLKRRGQVMVLACVTMLIVALTVMLSYNVNLAIHERIRLQSHADAMAFSLAVLEARALNFTAQSNRAIGSALTGGISIQAYVAIADNLIPQMAQSQQHHFVYAAKELELCPGCKPICAIHCKHAAEAMKVAGCFGGELSRVQGGHSAVQGAARGAMSTLRGQIQQLQQDSTDVVKWTSDQMSSGQLLSRLKEDNAPYAEGLNLLDKVSQGAWACGTEGVVDGNCSAITGFEPGMAGAGQLDELEHHVAMAARPDLDDKEHRNAANMAHQDYTNGPNPSNALIKNPPNPYQKCMEAKGTSKWEYDVPISGGELVGDNTTQNAEFKIPPSRIETWWRYDHISPWHIAGVAKGESTMPPLTTGYYYVHFRLQNNSAFSFNYPNAYAGTKMVLSKSGRTNVGIGGGQEYPWQLNSTGRTTVNFNDTKWSIMLPPVDPGYAVAKGKAYFHQQNKWDQSPNGFDPFWHAKLHYFGRSELQAALNKVGDPNGAAVAGGATPVEGDTNAP